MVDQITIEGYKSFQSQTIKLGGLNVLIGSNGAGKSNFLSLFELLGNIFEQRLGAYVAKTGGVDKLLFQGRKVTEEITVNLVMTHNSYGVTLQEADGKLIVANEKLGCLSKDSQGNSECSSIFLRLLFQCIGCGYVKIAVA